MVDLRELKACQSPGQTEFESDDKEVSPTQNMTLWILVQEAGCVANALAIPSTSISPKSVAIHYAQLQLWLLLDDMVSPSKHTKDSKSEQFISKSNT